MKNFKLFTFNNTAFKLLSLFILMQVSLLALANDSAKLQAMYFDAARQGDIATLQTYYEAGLNPNVADEKGYTAIILSAYHGHTEAVKFLLSNKHVNPCQEDNTGNTALMGAIFKGNFGAIKALIKADCDIDQVNASGQTALMFATLFNRTNTINELSAAGANIKAKDKAGNGLTDIALSQGNYELAEALSKK